jgi:signal transduction histidine kinase
MPGELLLPEDPLPEDPVLSEQRDQALDKLQFKIEQLNQALAASERDKADLEILLEATTEHAVAIESELETTEANLRRTLEQEQALNQRIEELATLEERNRIARDIHDSLGHLLVGLNIQMETALALWNEDPAKAYTFLVKAKQLGSKALQATRQSVADLRSDPLQGQLLQEAIVTLIQDFHRTTGIHPNCQIHLHHPLVDPVRIVVYRVVQEGLTNICKHASATAVTLQIQSNQTGVSLTLKDNGQGFHMDANRSGFGLQGMQERITALGGNLEVISEPGKGCCIKASLPIRIKT